MQTFEQWTQNYRNLAARDRVSNRGKAHMVTMQQLSQFYPEFRGSNYEVWRERFGTHIDGTYSNEFLDNVLAAIRQQNLDLRRGDFVFIEFDIGYRNDGKTIFDGNRIIDLAPEPDDYGTIPPEFQIGEFPPLYWMDLIDHNTLVPFNVVERLPGLTLDNVRILSRRDGQGFHMIIPFLALNGETYAIADAVQIDPNDFLPATAQDFLADVRDNDYFNFYNSNFNMEDPLSLPEGFSYENIILHNYEA